MKSCAFYTSHNISFLPMRWDTETLRPSDPPAAPLSNLRTHRPISFLTASLATRTSRLAGWMTWVGRAAAPTRKRWESDFVSDDSMNSLEPLGFLQGLLAWPWLHCTPNGMCTVVLVLTQFPQGYEMPRKLLRFLLDIRIFSRSEEAFFFFFFPEQVL